MSFYCKLNMFAFYSNAMVTFHRGGHPLNHQNFNNNLPFWLKSNKQIVEVIIAFKRTDDHIFEKTLKIELSPIPQAYSRKANSSMASLVKPRVTWFSFENVDMFIGDENCRTKTSFYCKLNMFAFYSNAMVTFHRRGHPLNHQNFNNNNLPFWLKSNKQIVEVIIAEKKII
jgi:hypothetical protein